MKLVERIYWGFIMSLYVVLFFSVIYGLYQTAVGSI